jgi:SAM-dependent methyltransferase
MKLKRHLPRGRTAEQVKNHYLAEKAIAEKLKKAGREERKTFYRSMYEELFMSVPDHPRLTRRGSPEMTARKNREKYSMVGRLLDGRSVFVEFAPGDCKFAIDVSKKVKAVYALDISDQRDPGDENPDNFDFILYDGFDTDKVAPGSADMVFSDNLIEHLHPEDVKNHFELAYRMLRPGGRYIFRIPHAMSGPHDVSMFFSSVPRGFHLKEWTYSEIRKEILSAGFSNLYAYWQAKCLCVKMPYGYFEALERLLGRLGDGRLKVRLAIKALIPCVCCEAVK